MKGVVFTEFQELVEKKFGMEMYDRLVQRCELSTEGAYTSVGTYDHSELLQMVVKLAEATELPVSALVHAFGKHLFQKFTAGSPHLLKHINNSVDLLGNVEGFIHVEVRKLYPDAELPTFEFDQIEEGKWELTYKSTRPFADLAHGLVEAAVEHFDDPIDIEREDVEGSRGTRAKFVLTSRERVPSCQA